jgi:hypothetical protein
MASEMSDKEIWNSGNQEEGAVGGAAGFSEAAPFNFSTG